MTSDFFFQSQNWRHTYHPFFEYEKPQRQVKVTPCEQLAIMFSTTLLYQSESRQLLTDVKPWEHEKNITSKIRSLRLSFFDNVALKIKQNLGMQLV